MLAAAKYIGAGLACSGLIGAGAGIGIIFSSFLRPLKDQRDKPYKRNNCCGYRAVSVLLSNKIKIFK